MPATDSNPVVYSVQIFERQDDIYTFASRKEAERFADALSPDLDIWVVELPVNLTADALIAAERDRDA